MMVNLLSAHIFGVTKTRCRLLHWVRRTLPKHLWLLLLVCPHQGHLLRTWQLLVLYVQAHYVWPLLQLVLPSLIVLHGLHHESFRATKHCAKLKTCEADLSILYSEKLVLK